MKSPLRNAILRGFGSDVDEQEIPQQEAAEKAAAPPPKPGLGALARAIGRGKEVKKVTIVGGGGGAGDLTASGPKHGSVNPYHSGKVWDSTKKTWVDRGKLTSDRVVIEK